MCQIPWWEKEDFVGVIDIIDAVGYRYGNDKKAVRYEGKALEDKLASSNSALIAEIQTARQHLIEGLAEFDETIMDEFLAENENIDSGIIKAAIRRTIQSGDGKAIPVFAGSSFKHIGVEPLMDAIASYLPDPSDRPDADVRVAGVAQRLGEALSPSGKAKKGSGNITSVSSVFKVFEHPKEGVISYVRVYHGTLARNASTFNTNLQATERPMGILQISASKTNEVQELAVGQIGALRGLKKARTGDTIITTSSGSVPDSFRQVQVRPPEIPPPVAFLQVEPYGNVAAQELATALESAARQDPSLRWSRNPKTDQFTIQGMGKLHLDVSLHSIRQKYKIDAEFGPIEVDYKETVTQLSEPFEAIFDRSVASKPGRVHCVATVEPLEDYHNEEAKRPIEKDGNLFDITFTSGESAKLPFDLEEAHQQLVNGAVAGLARGPRRAAPVHGCFVRLSMDTSEGAFETPTGGHFSSAARMAVQGALRTTFDRGQVGILEPIMLVHITCPETAAGVVQHDITSGAGGHVMEVNDRSAESAGDDFIDVTKIYTPPDPYDAVTSLRGKKSTARSVEIVAKVPYKEMLDYDDHLRSKTAGRHSMTMSFDSFARVVGHREKAL